MRARIRHRGAGGVALLLLGCANNADSDRDGAVIPSADALVMTTLDAGASDAMALDATAGGDATTLDDGASEGDRPTLNPMEVPDGTSSTTGPTARARVSPERARRGAAVTVTLDGSASAGGALDYRWSLAGGTAVGGTLSDPTLRVAVTPASDLSFALTVSNAGGSDTAVATLRVDDPPIVDPGPDRIALVGERVSLDGSATVDPQGDPVSFAWRVSSAPDGARATLTDESTPTPRFSADRAGTYTLSLLASDPLGPAPEATVRVRVLTASRNPPTVSVTTSPPSPVVGSEVTLTVATTSAAPLVSTSLTVDGASLTLDLSQRARFTPTRAGRYEVIAVATDANGQSAEARASFSAHAGGAVDNGPPTVALTAPADGAVIAGDVPIMGTARDTDLARYVAELSPRGLDQWTPVATGTTSITSGRLGTLDPTRVAPGTYDLRLRAVDAFGRSATTPSRTVVIDLVGDIGALRFTVTDLAMELVGVPIRISRTYDSHDPRAGDFGQRWSMRVGAVERVERPNVPGVGWRFSGDCVRTRTVTELRAHPVVFRVAGRALVFRFAPEFVGCMGGGQNFRARFIPVGNVLGAVLGGYGEGRNLFLTSGDDTLVAADSAGAGAVFDPRSFTLTFPDGRQYTLDLDRGLTSERDALGNAITVTRSGINHSSGVAVSFTRDIAGRVTAIARPDGRRRTYSYNDRGDLVSATDWDGGSWTYLYAGAGRLARVFDPMGRPVATHSFDSDGELSAVTDALGRRVSYARDRAARTETITDRAGARTLIAYNPRGQVLSITGPSGATGRSEYDRDGNLSASIDPLGNRTEFTYDAIGRELSRRLPTGVMLTTTWNSRGHVSARTDGLGGRESFAYDTRGSLTSITEPDGAVLSLTRDPRGALTSVTRPGGATWHLAPTREGWLEALTDLRGNRHAMTLDRLGRTTEVRSEMGGTSLRATLAWTASGRPTEHSAPDGMTSSLGWDGAGRQVSVRNPVAGETRHVYDATGALTAVVAPGRGATVRESDAEGRVISATNGAGRRTVTARDAAGRITSVTGPDGATTRTSWRGDGLRERVTACRAGRRARVGARRAARARDGPERRSDDLHLRPLRSAHRDRGAARAALELSL